MSGKDEVIEFVRQLPDELTQQQIAAALRDHFVLPEVPGEVISPEAAEASWTAVINRRMEEMRSGQVKGVPAAEVLRRRKRESTT